MRECCLSGKHTLQEEATSNYKKVQQDPTQR